MRIVQLMTERSRYFNSSKNYWFSFKAFLISLIGLYFRCLSFRVVLVNTARPDGAFLFVVWFIHWKRIIRPFLFIDKQKQKLSIHELVADFWLANITKLDVPRNQSEWNNLWTTDGESIYESANTPNVYLQCVGIFYYRSWVNHAWKSCLLNCLINVA